MMKKRIFAILTAVLMLSSAITVPDTAVSAAGSGTEGTTYYVSTLHGKDSNDGTSEKTPFYSIQKINELPLSAGDKVLLECGSVFTDGYLHLYEKSGSADAPIVIDQYGTGADPIIDTNGQGVWYQNYGYRLDSATHVKNGYVSSSILLYDTQYIEINNIEIVNDATDIEADDYREAYVMDRTGVAAVAQNKGTIRHIRLNGLNIHDVYGNVYNKHMNNGGIYFTVSAPKGSVLTNGEIVSDKAIPRYDDVLIENCRLDTVNRWGIAVGYTAYWYKMPNGAKAIPDEDISTYGSANVVIRNNYVKNAGGDAITLMYCDRPLVEYNVADGVASHINPEIYTQIAGRGGRVAAGIWPWKCKNAVFQYNEAFDTKNGGGGGNDDAQAWDADSGDGTLYQYNYSHGNTGGCVMFCYGDAYHTTFRYNISQDDLCCVLDPSSNPDANVYNNTFYIAEGVPFLRAGHGGSGKFKATNNILYYTGATPKEESWYIAPNNRDYVNNIYYNYKEKPTTDTEGMLISADSGTQIFADPGKAPTSPLLGIVNPHNDPSVKSVFDGYKLVENSPAIGVGKAVSDYEGIDPSEKDFFGNDLTDVTTLDIGAHQYQPDENEAELLPPSVPKAETPAATEDSVTVSWPAVWDTSVNSYRIVVKDADGAEVFAKDLKDLSAITDPETGMLTYVIQNLKAGTTYTVEVIACDENKKESKPLLLTVATQKKKNEDEGGKDPGPSDLKNPSIQLDKASATIYTKAVTMVTINAILKDLEGASVIWTSSNPAVADVSGGVVTAKGAGEAVITAEANGLRASCTVTVKKPSISGKKTVKVKRGKKLKLKVTAEPAGKITYTSSNKKIAKVTKKGVVKGIKKGSCKVTVKCNGAKKVIKIKVK